MKILHVITSFSGMGGAEVALARLVNGADEHEHSIVALIEVSEGNRATIARPNVEVTALGMTRLWEIPLAVVRLRALILSHGPDLVVGWMYHANVVACLAALTCRPKVPLVWTIHHTLDRIQDEKISTRLAIRFSQRLSRLPRATVFVSEAVKHTHLACGFPGRREDVVINHGVASQPSEGSRTDVGTKRRKTVGALARFHPVKDYPTLVRAIELTQRADSDIAFRLGGPGIDAQNNALSKLLDEHDIDRKRVSLVGVVTNLRAFYADLDGFVVTSTTEAGPIVILEAMSFGVPCVSTDVGDARAMIGTLGTVVRVHDPGAVSCAIQHLMHRVDEDKQGLARSCRQHIAEHYSIERMVDQYLELFASVLRPAVGEATG